MTDKISDKDKKDWENFLKNPGKIEIKDNDKTEKINMNIEMSIDLHGYTLDDANHKIYFNIFFPLSNSGFYFFFI